MNRNFGKLVDGVVQYAPNNVRIGDTIYANPTAAQYAACGWLPVVDDRPGVHYGYHLERDGYIVADGVIKSVWREVQDAPRVRVFKVCELFWWAAQHGKASELDALLESQGLYSAAITQTEVSDADPNFVAILAAVQDALDLTDKEIDECLAAAEVSA